MTWLYRTETKGIQSWILSSGKLRDLEGGSRIVERLVAEGRERATAAGGRVRVAAAGGMTVTFDDVTGLEAFASTWPRHVYYAAPGLHTVQAWCRIEGSERDALERLHRELLVAARHRPWPRFPEAGPLVERAAWSGWPAVLNTARPTRAKGRRELLDRASAQREMARGGSFPGLDGLAFVDPDRWPEEPVAVLHADGSGIGAKVSERSDHGLDAVAAFSTDLHEATLAATRAALATVGSKGMELYARPIVLGGDDVTLLILARDAFRFAYAWLQSFENATAAARAIPGRLHAGAGIAVVHRKYPFDRAHVLAERACRAAKTAAADPNGTPAASGFAMVRNTASVHDPAAAMRGYRLDRMRDLDELARALDGIGRGGVREWLALVDAGDTRAQARWDRIKTVAKRGAWERIAGALKALGADPETGMFRPRTEGADSGGGASHPRLSPIQDAMSLRMLGAHGLDRQEVVA